MANESRHPDQDLNRVVHDLRSPVSAIASALEVLEALGPHDGEAKEMRGVIRRQIEQISHLIDDVCRARGTEQALIEAATEPACQPAGRNGNTPSFRILIIDDSRDAAFPVQMLLARLGHDAQVAVDGQSGLAAARELQPDVVLCDIGLPGGMNGYAVAEALRADRSTRRPFLVAATGYGKEEDRQRALEAGFDHHLTKPVGLETLKSLLASLATREPAGA